MVERPYPQDPTLSMTDDFRRKLEAHGPWFCFRTLMSDNPDHNRRSIQNEFTGEVYKVYNAEMRLWYASLNQEIDETVKRLNAEWHAQYDHILEGE